MRTSLIFILLILHQVSSAQDYTISGQVWDYHNRRLTGANIYIFEKDKGTVSDAEGKFQLHGLKPGKHMVHVSFIGYDHIEIPVYVFNSDTFVEVYLKEAFLEIEDVSVVNDRLNDRKKKSPVLREVVDKSYMQDNIGGSLMETLEKLPGVSSMKIGAGVSKPVIRGLGLNRIVVAENGIKQEGQQWGLDHGLEIDQFSIDRLEVIKGPASLQFGSDAIGGVVNIPEPVVPLKNSISGNVKLMRRSVNNLGGIAALVEARNVHAFYRISGTFQAYGDYRVPADYVVYNTFRLPINHKRLKNTAGRERNFSVTAGQIRPWGSTRLTVSNVYQKTGFFPGAHGIPNVAGLFHDSSFWDIDLPYQEVNHLKVINNTKIKLGLKRLNLDIGYQRNHRSEFSRFHTHYPGVEAPAINPNLELDFELHTLSANAVFNSDIDSRTSYSTGIQAAVQENIIGGYSFLMPRYTKQNAGVYYMFTHSLHNKKWVISSGIRYDFGFMDIRSFELPYLDAEERLRSIPLKRNFNDFSGSAGITWNISQNHNLKFNAGKSFRMPAPMELAANGVHHGSFRHEKGDPHLDSEQSYQFDLSHGVRLNKLTYEVGLFYNYFTNFIFLSPSGVWSSLPDGGQIYRFRDAAAQRTGADLFVNYRLFRLTHLHLSGEYVRATELPAKNEKFSYPVPFTPPPAIGVSIKQYLLTNNSFANDFWIQVHLRAAAKQNRVARNELPTPAYQVFDFLASANLHFGRQIVNVRMQVNNVFNARYLNHLSFYRLIEVPEPGRNFQLYIALPFSSELKPKQRK